MATIRVTTPLHVRIAAVKGCMVVLQVRFLFALMVPHVSMNIGASKKVAATLFTPVFTVSIAMISIQVINVTLDVTTKSTYN
jgi:hypothetical protein